MTTPIDPYASATSQQPLTITDQLYSDVWNHTVNTATLNFSSSGTVSNGVFGYTGTPDSGNLYFSLSSNSGADNFGNTYPTGLSVTAGMLQGTSIIGASMDSTSTLTGTNIQNAQVLTPSISGGTAASLVHTMTNTNGSVLGYTIAAASATFPTNGTYLWTVPTGITSVRVQCWGAAAGGSGCNPTSSSNQGGPGGGAGEYAEEPSYPVMPGQVFQIVVGNGGQGGAAGFTGGDGTVTQFYPVGGGGLTVTANPGLTSPDLQNGGAGGSGSSNTIHFDGGGGASSNGGTGGGGGGSSASAAGQGNPGNTATGATGGTGGAGISGGGAGGAGGNSGSGGVNGSAPGGAGGGGGTSSISQSKTYSAANGTYSYFGADASSGVKANGLRNTNGPMFQGEAGPAVSGGSAGGHQYSYLTLPYAQIQSDLSGQTVTGVSVTLVNTSTYYTTGMTVNLSYSNKTSFGSTSNTSGATAVQNWTIARGATLTHKVPVALGSALQSGAAKSLLFGPASSLGLQGYGYYSPSGCSVTVFYHAAGTFVSGGSGADGQVLLTYGSASTPVYQLSVSAVNATDTFGNTLKAGFTAGINPGANLSSTAVTITNGSGSTASSFSGTTLTFNTSGGNIVLTNDGNGIVEYTNSADSQTYVVGATTQFLASPFTCNSTSAQQLPGMIFNVLPRVYHINGVIRYVAAASGTTQPMTFQFHASAGVSSVAFKTNTMVEAAGQQVNPGFVTALSANPTVVTGNVPNNDVLHTEFDGNIVVSSSGTFGLFVNQVTSSSDETFTIQASNRTWWRIEPQ